MMVEPTRLPALPRMPVTGVSNDLGVAVAEVREVPIGVPLASLPALLGIEDGGILLCKCNGEFLLRSDWQSLTRHNDVIEWYSLSQNRQAARIPDAGGGLLHRRRRRRIHWLERNELRDRQHRRQLRDQRRAG